MHHFLLENYFTPETNILVTGGAGFIGGCLVRKLLNETKSRIFNIDKLGYASDLSWLKNHKNSSNHKLINIDLFDAKKTQDAINLADPDYVIHLAAESHVDRSIEDPKIFINSNISGTFNLIDIIRKHWDNLPPKRKSNFRFLHVSTDEVFGTLGDEGVFTEKTKYDPRSPYSASKACSDHLISAWHHTFGIPTLVTNCSNNFGPRQFPEKLIPLIILKAINKEKIPIYGDGKNIRDWLFVEDHVKALIMVLIKGEVGEKYCIGGNTEKNNFEIAVEICNLISKKIDNQFNYKDLIEFVKDRPGHDRRYAIDTSYIKKKLNWSQENNFKVNLESTVQWYITNQNWCDSIKSNSNYKGQRLGI